VRTKYQRGILMSYPKNPETIVLKNRFYPKGMKEIDVWNHYQKFRGPVLDQTRNRDLMFYIFTEVNKPIIRRKAKSGYIRLTPQNYDQIITGRTVSIHSAMGQYESFGIIDIDVHPDDGFRWARKVTADVYDYVMDHMPIVRSATIRFTGKTSFHVICDFGVKMKVDVMRFMLEKFLRQSPLVRAYQVAGKRTRGVPNLDLAPNKFRGNYITLNSLSIIGLRCMEVSFRQLQSLNPNKARI